ncbi:MAG: hypothetical protein ILA02_01145 [Clostridia bacterium]|nr:hypothetical protein [Clostridia bacterium]
MSDLKKDAKIVLLVVAGFLLSGFLIFVGLNSNYKPIRLSQELPQQITIEKAEANKDQGRVYGYVQNNNESNLNGKYLKISVYNSKEEIIATEYLKIENLQSNDKKLFRSNFNAKNAISFDINIIDNK